MDLKAAAAASEPASLQTVAVPSAWPQTGAGAEMAVAGSGRARRLPSPQEPEAGRTGVGESRVEKRPLLLGLDSTGTTTETDI